MINVHSNDAIYREIEMEILSTHGNYDVTTIIENVQALGFAVEISVMESRIKTYLSNAPKNIQEMVKKAKEVTGA